MNSSDPKLNSDIWIEGLFGRKFYYILLLCTYLGNLMNYCIQFFERENLMENLNLI